MDILGFSYLGVAVEHPIVLFVGGRPRMTAGQSAVEQSITHILDTPHGSLLFKPNYGSEIHKLYFMANTTVVHSLLARYIKEAIDRFETRVEFKKCDIVAQEDLCVCRISYRHLASNEVNSMVYPFYRNG